MTHDELADFIVRTFEGHISSKNGIYTIHFEHTFFTFAFDVKTGKLSKQGAEIQSLNELERLAVNAGMKKRTVQWVVAKTEATTGDLLSVVGNPHDSEDICSQIATNCNRWADAGIHYIVKQF